MTAFDHLLAVILVLVFPPLTAWDVPRLARRVEADPVNARTIHYQWNMTLLWGLTTMLVVGWEWAGRPLRELGVQLPDRAAAWSWTLLLCSAITGFLVQQAYSVARSPDAQAKVREQLEAQPALRTVLPSTPREARLFVPVAVTAGVCEEVLYRGFLLWYLRALMPAATAIAAAIAAFGVVHAYQGVRGVFSTGMAGAVFMAAYLLTGSLLAPIVLHAIVDLVNGLMLHRMLRPSAAADA
jgi:membrane protease YdiL (CAAX protease family)